MPVTVAQMESWLKTILGADAGAAKLSLGEYVQSIPKLESLADVPSGTPVLVRGDTDAKPGPKVGEGDIRLVSMKETLQFGRARGWKQIVFGHIGREPEKSLSKVRSRLGEILGCEVTFVADWLDAETNTIKAEALGAVQSAAPGSVILLENTRKYPIERVLWKAKAGDIPALAPKLAALAGEFQKLAKVYVHEAFSAGSLDASSVVVPAGMDRVALGQYEAQQFTGPLMECLDAQLVVSSGLKIDKLDDLEAMISRGKIRWVFSAGSLAMGLKKAAAQLDGGDFSIGVQQDPAQSDKPWYIPPQRVEQAKQMIADGRAKGIQFVMPVDFVVQDGSVKQALGPGDQQFDVGPASSALYEKKVGEFLGAAGKGQAVAFHNGVFGMFEDQRFAEGTRKWIPQLKRMHDAGVKVYVGGGEGGTALEKYGKPDWVTYNFTAGGTVLNALGSEPVPYLVALRLAAKR